MPAGSFASSELSAEQIRAATFTTVHDGGWHPGEVREFLEQVAAAVEVITSRDLVEAIRAELRRSADISARIVLAGQETVERMRSEAMTEIEQQLARSKAEAAELRDNAEREAALARGGMEDMRNRFVAELRDIYDRIGASLYRFERAIGEDAHPAAAVQEAVEPVVEHAAAAAIVAEAQAVHAAVPLDTPLDTPEVFDLPPEGDRDDEPLLDGDALVDLTAISEQIAAAREEVERSRAAMAEEAAGASAGDDDDHDDDAFEPDPGQDEALAFELGDDPLGTVLDSEPTEEVAVAPEPEIAPPAEAEPVVASPEPAPAPEAGGMSGWLEDTGGDDVGASSVWDAPSVDERAASVLEDSERLLDTIEVQQLPQPPALSTGGVAEPIHDPFAAEPYAELVPPGVDLAQVREVVLQSIGDGMTRDVVAKHLREQLGISEAEELIERLLRG